MTQSETALHIAVQRKRLDALEVLAKTAWLKAVVWVLSACWASAEALRLTWVLSAEIRVEPKAARKGNALLVVLVLILTATYQATLCPPGGFGQVPLIIFIFIYLTMKRLKRVARAGNIDELYTLIGRDAYILERVDQMPFSDTPLHIASAAGHIDFAMEIMNLKPSFARKLNQDGFSPIHLALQQGQTAMVLRLLVIDKDLVRVKGREGKTPLHYVASEGNLSLLAQFLLRCPKCIQDVTIRNETALHIVAENDNLRALRVLLQSLKRTNLYGKSSEKRLLNFRDKDGNTVLHIAASKNQPQMVKLLIECRVSINKTNSRGLTALDILESMSNVDNRDSLEILRDFGGLNGSATPRPPPLHVMLGSKITLLENAFGEVFHDIITMSADRSNALLVVLVLILTATYQAALTPPFPFSGASTGSDSANNTSTDSTVRKSVMASTAFLLFYIPNTIAFIIAMILTLGLLAIVASGITTLLLFTGSAESHRPNKKTWETFDSEGGTTTLIVETYTPGKYLVEALEIQVSMRWIKWIASENSLSLFVSLVLGTLYLRILF
ncbi:ankyrin repeat-containing protein BDA1-like [Herrania umbratica]|uniref:Ankyrin repeat-containing protein BDA1-like n=1 Tax=Herrania umbratica TaxID=108875 RepID=A0A6J1B9V5_9ROSI|nr:ankyrin repeat-containing protein BDA1-like [Herrania umbratica]